MSSPVEEDEDDHSSVDPKESVFMMQCQKIVLPFVQVHHLLNIDWYCVYQVNETMQNKTNII